MASDILEQQLVEEVAKCAKDPLRFVRFAFPWGEGDLAGYPGPDQWQTEALAAIRDNLSTAQPVRIAVASGHCVGKSALVSWLILWALATFPDARATVTAGTEGQLRTKTWPELAKWHRRCICGHWLEMTATALHARQAGHEKSWRADAVPWSEHNTEAFSGLHNQGRRILLVFDEASAIADSIWEVSEGALTDASTEIIWLAFGNPTRNTGRFRECFGRWQHRWITKQVDSRNVRVANAEQITQWVSDYGEDSDFVRVRVRGVFPRAGTMQFIPSDLAAEAMQREAVASMQDPLILGVDVARFGEDSSVICIRKGRDARTYAPVRLRGVSTTTLSARVADIYQHYRADAVFVDGGGVGGGVVDQLRAARVPVHDIQFGSKADRVMPGQEMIHYANKRAEMWGLMREWLQGGSIPNNPELAAELTGLEFGYVMREGRDAIQLESKVDMKKRGLASPDWADALALTFAYPVMAGVHSGYAGAGNHPRVLVDYEPLDDPPARSGEYSPFAPMSEQPSISWQEKLQYYRGRG